MKVKSESEVAQSCPILATPWTAAYKAPPSMGFARQEYIGRYKMNTIFMDPFTMHPKRKRNIKPLLVTQQVCEYH